MSDLPKLWEPVGLAPLHNATTPAEIARHAVQLSSRDQVAVVAAIEAGNFEMATSFVWARAMAALKKQLASLGTDFVGEMLARPDITADSAIESVLTDADAVQLAADLGMMSSTAALRMRHTLETVQHFAGRAVDAEERDGMTHNEAVGCLQACVQAVLSEQQASGAIKFAEFRKELETRVFGADDPKMDQLRRSPYLFQRTTLTVLLALIKSSKTPILDTALANINVVLPLVWANLRKPEKYQTGEAYTFVYSSGNKTAAAGLRSALLKVRGFDFVPETLRSETYVRAAAAVIQAHEAMDNFYYEKAPMQVLASLGNSIPIPALPQCMTAVLCVRLGNTYGYAWSAQESAMELLSTITPERWSYYLNECLPGDRRVIDKLFEDKPRKRWVELVAEFRLGEKEIKNQRVRRLIEVSRVGGHVWPAAMELIGAYSG